VNRLQRSNLRNYVLFIALIMKIRFISTFKFQSINICVEYFGSRTVQSEKHNTFNFFRRNIESLNFITILFCSKYLVRSSKSLRRFFYGFGSACGLSSYVNDSPRILVL
jgi:hypothetical protein